MTDTAPSNADQIAFWNSEVGARWVTMQARTDALFAPITAAAIDHAAPAAGEAVVDIGCGCGATVLDLAARVGPAGRVLGVDVSEPMLGLAAQRTAGLATVRLELADASGYAFEAGACDLVFSRFGVMFFADPVAAFANIRTALRPGGRLGFVCWRKLAENSWFSVPFAAAAAHLPPAPPPDPLAPGPFAFADPDRVRGILEAAGFSAVSITPDDHPMLMGGPGGVADAALFATQMGPVSRALGEADAATRVAAEAAILEALRAYERPEGIVLGGGVWLVSARA